MKIIPLLLLLLAGVWLGRVALNADDPNYRPEVAEVPNTLPGHAPDGYRDVTISVEGMCGPCCERTLFDTVRDLEGVQEVAVSFDDEAVIVRLPEGQDTRPVLEALTTDQHTPSVEL